MVCECADCTEFGCNFHTVHRWNGDFDFKGWDITTALGWRDYLTDNQPQKTSLLWRLRYDGEPGDAFMRSEFPRSAFHQWGDTWRVINSGPVRDNRMCSPWWGVRQSTTVGWWISTDPLRQLGFTLASGSPSVDEFQWRGRWAGVSPYLDLPFAIDVGCVRCGARGQPNHGVNWPNPPGWWHDFEFDFLGFVPDIFQLPTEQDVIDWIAAKRISDQALYPDEYLPDVLPWRWRPRLVHTVGNYNTGAGGHLQSALWAGDRGNPNPSLGCIPGLVAWANRSGSYAINEPSSPPLFNEDSNYHLPTAGGRSVAWYEGFSVTGRPYTQHTTHVTLSDYTPAVFLVGARNLSVNNPTISQKPLVAPADWAQPLVDWLATGNKFLIIDNPVCNFLPGANQGYPSFGEELVNGIWTPFITHGQAQFSITPSGTTSHAAAANAMLTALGSSMQFGDLINMNRHGDPSTNPNYGLPFATESTHLAPVGSDSLRSGFGGYTVAALGDIPSENSLWGWDISGGTPLVEATRRFGASAVDAVGFNHTWTCCAVERFANGSAILIGGWEGSHTSQGGFYSLALAGIWSNMLAELPA